MTKNNDLLLLVAARNGDLTQVQALIASGAKVDISDPNGTTALMFAANSGYTEIVRSLLNAGANINLPRKRYGLTALMLAVSLSSARHCKFTVTKWC